MLGCGGGMVSDGSPATPLVLLVAVVLAVVAVLLLVMLLLLLLLLLLLRSAWWLLLLLVLLLLLLQPQPSSDFTWAWKHHLAQRLRVVCDCRTHRLVVLLIISMLR